MSERDVSNKCQKGMFRALTRKVDVRLPRKRNSNSYGARPVHLIITMFKWIRTNRLSIANSLSFEPSGVMYWTRFSGDAAPCRMTGATLHTGLYSQSFGVLQTPRLSCTRLCCSSIMNIIPILPLDGVHVLEHILPESTLQGHLAYKTTHPL